MIGWRGPGGLVCGSIPRPRTVANRRPIQGEREREMRTELYDRITRYNVCDRIVAVGDETCTVEDARQMILVDVSAMTERELDWMDSMGVVGDGHTIDRLPDLIVDAYRYRTMVATVEMRGGLVCPVCELAHGKTTVIDGWMTAELVEWNVIGDPRPYVLICPECSDD